MMALISLKLQTWMLLKFAVWKNEKFIWIFCHHLLFLKFGLSIHGTACIRHIIGRIIIKYLLIFLHIFLSFKQIRMFVLEFKANWFGRLFLLRINKRNWSWKEEIGFVGAQVPHEIIWKSWRILIIWCSEIWYKTYCFQLTNLSCSKV